MVSIRMPEDRMTRQSKGFAFVTMESERAARKALNYDGHRVMKRPLKVRLAESKIEHKPEGLREKKSIDSKEKKR